MASDQIRDIVSCRRLSLSVIARQAGLSTTETFKQLCALEAVGKAYCNRHGWTSRKPQVRRTRKPRQKLAIEAVKAAIPDTPFTSEYIIQQTGKGMRFCNRQLCELRRAGQIHKVGTTLGPMGRPRAVYVSSGCGATA